MGHSKDVKEASWDREDFCMTMRHNDSFFQRDVASAVSYSPHARDNWHFLQHQSEDGFRACGPNHKDFQLVALQDNYYHALSYDWHPHYVLFWYYKYHRNWIWSCVNLLEHTHTSGVNDVDQFKLPVHSTILICSCGPRMGGSSSTSRIALSLEKRQTIRCTCPLRFLECRSRSERPKFWKDLDTRAKDHLGISVHSSHENNHREVHFSENNFSIWNHPSYTADPIWLFCSHYRIGEAQNPGPFHHDLLRIFHCNPTQLWGKVDEVLNFGSGTTFLSETSATAHAQNVMTKQLCKQHAGVQWSKPVPVYPQSNSNLRGFAGGTAIISSMPITPVLEPLPSDLINSDRISEGVIQYAPGCYMYGASLYGPTMSNRYNDPLEILNRHTNVAGQRAMRFEGPAIISGDLNVPLEYLQIWPSLQRAGWMDAHVLSQQLNGHAEDMTCAEATRHSFILINPPLVACLKKCRTTKHFIFSQHPVLFAEFEITSLKTSTWVWKLPKSFDRFFQDEQIAHQVAEEQINQCKSQCDKYIAKSDTTALAKQWARCAEATLAAAAVAVEGNLIKVRRGHFGRDLNRPFAKRLPSTPIIKPPRKDHYCAQLTQGTIEIRGYLKQLHRIQTLHAVVKSTCRTGEHQQRKSLQALHLWNLVRTAKGFSGGFDAWLYEFVGTLVPVGLPEKEYIDNLLQVYLGWFQKIETSVKLHKINSKKIDIIADIRQG